MCPKGLLWNPKCSTWFCWICGPAKCVCVSVCVCVLMLGDFVWFILYMCFFKDFMWFYILMWFDGVNVKFVLLHSCTPILLPASLSLLDDPYAAFQAFLNLDPELWRVDIIAIITRRQKRWKKTVAFLPLACCQMPSDAKKSQEYNSITKIVLESERLTFWEELCMKSKTGLHEVGCTSSTILATLPDSWAGFELQRMAVLALATFLLDLRKWKDLWVH